MVPYRPLIHAIKQWINSVSQPYTIFSMAVLFFILFIYFRKFLTSFAGGIVLLVLSVGFFAVGLTNLHFRQIVGTPDNVPIVGMIFIFGYFTWFAIKKGVENDRRIEKGEPTVEQLETNDKVLVFPYLIFIEFVIALAYAVMLVLWSLLLKAPLEEPANPTVSPNPSKAPWYFLGLQEMLVYFDPWIAGVLLPTFIILGLCAIPYIDRDPENSGFYCFKARKNIIITYLFGFWILWILLILVGTFLRGPNWNFFGPLETWDVHKVVPLLNVNLSEIVYIKWLGWGLPKPWFIREAPGFLILFFYFALPSFFLTQSVFKNLYKKVGPARYSVLLILLLVMLALPVKMYLRWAFNLKYIVAIPEFFFNI